MKEFLNFDFTTAFENQKKEISDLNAQSGDNKNEATINWDNVKISDSNIDTLITKISEATLKDDNKGYQALSKLVSSQVFKGYMESDMGKDFINNLSKPVEGESNKIDSDSKITELEASVKQLQSEIESYKVKVKEYEDNINGLTEANQSITNELDTLRNKEPEKENNTSSNQIKDDDTKDSSALKDKVEQLTNQLSEAKDLITELEKELKTARQTIEEKTRNLTEDDTQDAIVTKLRSDSVEAAKRIEELEAQISNKNKENESLTEQLEKLKKDEQSQATKELESLQTELQESKMRADQLQTSEANFRAQMDESNIKITDLNSKLEESNKQVQTLTSELESFKQSSAANAQLEDSQKLQEIDNLKLQNENYKSDIEKVSNELEEQKLIVSKLSTERDNLNNQVTTIQNLLDEQKQVYESRFNELTDKNTVPNDQNIPATSMLEAVDKNSESQQADTDTSNLPETPTQRVNEITENRQNEQDNKTADIVDETPRHTSDEYRLKLKELEDQINKATDNVEKLKSEQARKTSPEKRKKAQPNIDRAEQELKSLQDQYNDIKKLEEAAAPPKILPPIKVPGEQPIEPPKELLDEFAEKKRKEEEDKIANKMKGLEQSDKVRLYLEKLLDHIAILDNDLRETDHDLEELAHEVASAEKFKDSQEWILKLLNTTVSAIKRIGAKTGINMTQIENEVKKDIQAIETVVAEGHNLIVKDKLVEDLGSPIGNTPRESTEARTETVLSNKDSENQDRLKDTVTKKMYDSLQDELTTLRSTSKAAEDNFTLSTQELNDQINTMKNRIRELEELLEHNKKQLEQSQSGLLTNVKEKSDEITQLKNKVQELEEINSTLTDTISRDDYNKLEAIVQELSDKAAGTEAERTKLSLIIDAKNDEIKNLNSRLEQIDISANSETQKFNQQIQDLTVKLEEAEKRKQEIDLLKEELEKAKAEVANQKSLGMSSEIRDSIVVEAQPPELSNLSDGPRRLSRQQTIDNLHLGVTVTTVDAPPVPPLNKEEVQTLYESVLSAVEELNNSEESSKKAQEEITKLRMEKEKLGDHLAIQQKSLVDLNAEFESEIHNSAMVKSDIEKITKIIEVLQETIQRVREHRPTEEVIQKALESLDKKKLETSEVVDSRVGHSLVKSPSRENQESPLKHGSSLVVPEHDPAEPIDSRFIAGKHFDFEMSQLKPDELTRLKQFLTSSLKKLSQEELAEVINLSNINYSKISEKSRSTKPENTVGKAEKDPKSLFNQVSQVSSNIFSSSPLSITGPDNTNSNMFAPFQPVTNKNPGGSLFGNAPQNTGIFGHIVNTPQNAGIFGNNSSNLKLAATQPSRNELDSQQRSDNHLKEIIPIFFDSTIKLLEAIAVMVGPNEYNRELDQFFVKSVEQSLEAIDELKTGKDFYPNVKAGSQLQENILAFVKEVNWREFWEKKLDDNSRRQIRSSPKTKIQRSIK